MNEHELITGVIFGFLFPDERIELISDHTISFITV